LDHTSTEIIQVDPTHPDPTVLERAGALIRAGELVAFPTETVYGLGANALDAAAVQRIFDAKGRATDDPIIVHVADLDGLRNVVASVPPVVQQLADRFWPGPLTLVLPRGEAIPLVVTAGLDTVAVRMPSHPVPRGLLAAAGVPIAAPSANRFTRPSATEASHVATDLGGKIALILDAGPATHGLESTVLDLTDTPSILRPGALTLEDLRAVLPNLPNPRRAPKAEPATYRSPGTMLKHYSPRAEMIVLDGPDPDRVQTALVRLAEQSLEEGRRVGILLPAEDLQTISMVHEESNLVVASLGPRDDLAAQGQRLFAAIRELDQAHVDVIITRLPPPRGLGVALRDRLQRAASGTIVEIS
jgi:L-threonylcarbamoyladenylate synthase